MGRMGIQGWIFGKDGMHRLGLLCNISNSTPGAALPQKIRVDSGTGQNLSSNLRSQGFNPSFTFPRGFLGQPGVSCPPPAPLQGPAERGGFEEAGGGSMFCRPPGICSRSCSHPSFPFPGAELHRKSSSGGLDHQPSPAKPSFNGIQRKLYSRTKPPLPSRNDPCVSKEISSPLRLPGTFNANWMHPSFL